MSRLLLVFVLFSLSAAQPSPPIPIQDTDPGVRYDPTSVGAPVKLEVMLEVNCPDSLMAWPELKLAADFYGPTQLDLVVYQFQLPYHRWGHLGTLGFYAVQDLQSDADALLYMEYILSVWTTYSGGNTENSTHLQVLDQLAVDANIATGIDPQAFKDNINNYGGKAVWTWKLATRRGAAGTPWYYLNGVDLGYNVAITYEELRALIDPLLN